MNQYQQMDIFIGVKAEQTLRDAVRLQIDNANTDIELTPVGKKDWIAGIRIENDLKNSDIEVRFRMIHKKLMALGTEQRIRFENLKIYVVSKPVPVFKDPDPDELLLRNTQDNFHSLNKNDKKRVQSEEFLKLENFDSKQDSLKNGPSICPVCKRTVHSYNLHYNSNGKVIGCFMCGGIPDNF